MKYIREFLKRGFVAAWGGPVVLAIIFLCHGGDEITLSAAYSQGRHFSLSKSGR